MLPFSGARKTGMVSRCVTIAHYQNSRLYTRLISGDARTPGRGFGPQLECMRTPRIVIWLAERFPR